jgi:oligopeptide/dipeptide ABC transporter ATP-binding protein
VTSLLQLDDLSLRFVIGDNEVPVVRGVDLSISKGEIVGLVGESGCGKSVTCMAAMGLLDDTSKLGGDVFWKGQKIKPTNDAAMSTLRGNEMAMIFQDPMSALNPVKRIGKQLTEAIRINSPSRFGGSALRDRAIQLLRDVGVPEPEKRLSNYPHQLSGGLSQRVMIAMMLAGDPDLLIADEPTTALDVTVQAQIMDLLKTLRDTRDMSVILVTHDLGVVAEVCDRIYVMYCGRIIESGRVRDVFANPRHPYTRGLLASLPRVDQAKGDLSPVPGVVPLPTELGSGCDFAARCARKLPRCDSETPALSAASGGTACACLNPCDGSGGAAQ